MAEQAEMMHYFLNTRLRTDLGQGTKRSYFHDVVTKCAEQLGCLVPNWWRFGALILFDWHVFVSRVLHAGRGLLQGDKEEFNERLQEAYASLEFTRIQMMMDKHKREEAREALEHVEGQMKEVKEYEKASKEEEKRQHEDLEKARKERAEEEEIAHLIREVMKHPPYEETKSEKERIDLEVSKLEGEVEKARQKYEARRRHIGHVVNEVEAFLDGPPTDMGEPTSAPLSQQQQPMEQD